MSKALRQALQACAPVRTLLADMRAQGTAEADLLLHQARLAEAPAGAVLFRPGEPCGQYLVVLAGVVRVSLTAENGREMLLYRVGPGQTCVLTTMALLGRRRHEAEGRAEGQVRALALPAAAFDALLARSTAFRRFVFDSLSMRVLDLMHLAGQVAFARLDARLAAFLLHQAADGELRMTHQDIAVELAASREAVSRLLKRFEQQGLLKLGRGRLRLRDVAALSRMAEETTVPDINDA